MLLLDTCTFLWWATDDERVPERVRALRKLALPVPPGEYIPDRRRRMGITALSVEESDVLASAKLPRLHRDPFDRMLVSQAIARGLMLVSPDPPIQAYPCLTW